MWEGCQALARVSSFLSCLAAPPDAGFGCWSNTRWLVYSCLRLSPFSGSPSCRRRQAASICLLSSCFNSPFWGEVLALADTASPGLGSPPLSPCHLDLGRPPCTLPPSLVIPYYSTLGCLLRIFLLRFIQVDVCINSLFLLIAQ